MAERVIVREELEDWLSQGLSRKEIVAAIESKHGVRVTGPAVSMAMSKWGFKPLRNRHEDLIPWKVRTEHAEFKEVTFLRKLARRRKGLPNPARLEVWVDNFLDRLAEADAVIMYIPDAIHEEDVFSYVPREDSDGPSLREDRDNGAVIRRP